MATLMKNKKWFDENAVDVDFIADHEDLTPRGPIHTPVSSAEILTKFREKAKNLGLRLVNEKGAMKRDGNRYMYVADVEDDSHPDYALSVGFRNHNDTSLSFNAMLSSHVFVCSNGVCHGVVVPSKMRHTRGNVHANLIEDKLDYVFNQFEANKDEIHEQISIMRNTTLSDDIVGKFMRGLVGNTHIGATNSMRILELTFDELENPTLNSHNDNSVMRLMNAASYVTTHKMKNPNQGVMASNFCNNLIMSIIKPDFHRIGESAVEVIDVD